MLLSVIVPCYNEEENVPIFYEEMMKNSAFLEQEKLELEIIYIDDGSKDNTAAEVRKLHEKDERVHLVSFSRNFGKEAGIYAGFQKAKGDYVVMMDADLQDPPSLLPEMFSYIKQGYDSVATRRVTRKGEPPIRSFFARMFYRLIRHISDIDIVDGARDYRLMNRKMKDAIVSMTEYNRFSKGIFGWVGFRTQWLPYENVERVAGETKWSFWKLLIYSIEGIVAFTTVPLTIAAYLGLIFCVVAFFMVLVVIGKTLMFGDPVGGWPSLACIILFVGGIQLLCAGIVGKYLAKIYLEVKRRPIYLVAEENLDRNHESDRKGRQSSENTSVSEEEADKAEAGAKALFAGGADADIPTTTLTEADLQDGSIDILGLLVKSGLSASRSEARRSVEQGGVSVNGEKVTDVKTQYAGEDLQGEGITLKRGKKSFKKIVMA